MLAAKLVKVLVQDNPFLHEVFDYTPRASRQTLSAYEKRVLRSPASASSKSRARERSHARATSASHKGSMLTSE